MSEDSSSNRLFYMPRISAGENQNKTDDGRRRDEASAMIMLHPFRPRIHKIKSLGATATHTDRTTANHEAYCSAPPLILPPRPSRDQEALRPRNLIWLGKREAPDAETVFAIDHADKADIKPDTAMLAAASSSARPKAPAKMTPPSRIGSRYRTSQCGWTESPSSRRHITCGQEAAVRATDPRTQKCSRLRRRLLLPRKSPHRPPQQLRRTRQGSRAGRSGRRVNRGWWGQHPRQRHQRPDRWCRPRGGRGNASHESRWAIERWGPLEPPLVDRQSPRRH